MLKGNAPAFFFILAFLGVAGAVFFCFATAPVDWMHEHIRQLQNQRRDAMQEEAFGLGLVERTDISAGSKLEMAA